MKTILQGAGILLLFFLGLVFYGVVYGLFCKYLPWIAGAVLALYAYAWLVDLCVKLKARNAQRRKNKPPPGGC